MRHFFGIEDEEFIRGDVPMTKREIRMAVLNEARVQEDSYVLDVGAGTAQFPLKLLWGHLKAMYMRLNVLKKALSSLKQMRKNSASII